MTMTILATTTNSPSNVLSGVPKSASALLIAELLAGKHVASAPKTILHVASGDREIESLARGLAFFAPHAEVLSFPAWDCLPYDRASPRAGIMAERMRVLAALASGHNASAPRVILTTANAVLQKLPPAELMREVTVALRVGQTIKQSDLVHALLAQGYRRAGKAMEPGEFALRGGIIDIVAPGMEGGIRIDLFGDDVESIKPFDPLTQITSGTLKEALLFPVSEALLSEAATARFRERYRELFGAVTRDDPLYESISEGRAYPGMEHWLPLFYERVDTLLGYAPDALLTFDADAQTAMEERWETIRDYYGARVEALAHKGGFAGGGVYHPLPPEKSFLMESGWEAVTEKRERIFFSPFASDAHSGYRPALPFAQGQPDRTPFDQLKEHTASHAATLIACFTQGSRERLFTLLMERGFHCITIESWAEISGLRGNTIGLSVLPLENGFSSAKFSILSEQDVLGERIARARPKKKKSDVFLAEAANFAEGELVVHKEHGIGRFMGLVTLTVQNAAHDCLKIIYDGDDKLFLPVENIDMVTRFGIEEEGVALDKLGGASWQSRKAKLKQRITMAAEALLKIAAERQLRSGAVMEIPTGTYEDFCARFPYAETEDQARAIAEVLEDLHGGKPMDRLICGDVGFGKTEVALRAAFVASMNNVIPSEAEGSLQRKDPSTPLRSAQDDRLQVALICPTTLLARQHYLNFHERFKGFPVKVAQLSRIVPARAQKETREKLASGEIDIVIGTHALLAKNVTFKNLGLLIVDEEQHFGVAQKEKLKELKSDVHVLTLSATPIPRTLQMALTGVRDLSLITTPPIDRLAVRSFVMPHDPVVIREALLRERHRGGKSFVVTPRVKDINDLKHKLAELVPEVKIGVAHGQMAPGALDDIMNDFYDNKFDVLLSTAIIESGLDIADANTMIIHNAHLFGLSQLYQLRGRVGRGKQRAYAYFLLPHYRDLTKNATRRLEVMQTLDTLGAGFSLASHDMDIRGFGNLVGEEQSGHIREVGIELYQQMLEEAVAALKARDDGLRMADDKNSSSSSVIGHPSSDWSPQINLGISVLIPEDYVSDLALRLGLYRRVAGMSEEAEIESFAAEMVDRFGPMPQEVSHLIAVLEIKLLCKRAGIERVDAGPKGAVIALRENKFANPDALLSYIAKNARSLKARPDQKLVFSREWKNEQDTIAAIKKLAGEISALC